MATPGKLDKSKWEQPAAAAASGGAAVASGAKGMASKFEQAAKDAAPPAVVKKVPWSTTCRCVCVCGYVLLIRVRVYALSRSRGRHRARAAVSRMRASTSRRPSSATALRRPSRLLTCPEHLPSEATECVSPTARITPLCREYRHRESQSTYRMAERLSRQLGCWRDQQHEHSFIHSFRVSLAHSLTYWWQNILHSFIRSFTQRVSAFVRSFTIDNHSLTIH